MRSSSRSHRVAVLAFDGMSPFHLSVPCLVLGERFGGLPPRYDVVVCAEQPGRLSTTAGFGVVVEEGLEAVRAAETIVLPSWDVDRQPSATLVRELQRAHGRGARVIGLCLGTFLVAAAGLAEGREVVTHWRHADELQRRHPSVTVRSDVLWVDGGDLITSAGTAASLDCCLHVVRSDHGAEAAAVVARAVVLAPHRGGSQAQYVQLPVAPSEPDDVIEHAMVWARARLHDPVSLDEWARSAGLSRRTFTRRFRERTGTSGQRWLLEQRLDRARQLLETTDHSVDRVAAASGFGSAETLRHHFRARLRTTPVRHRAQFAGR